MRFSFDWSSVSCTSSTSPARRAGDVVSVREKSRNLEAIQESVEAHKSRSTPDWLSLDDTRLSGRVLMAPTRDGIDAPIQEQMIVELYSK